MNENFNIVDPKLNNESLKKALDFATTKHKGQKRMGGEEYISHPVAVANILKNMGYGVEYQIAAILHDLLEDTDATENEIYELSNKNVLKAVILMTKKKGYVMQEYIDGIIHDEVAHRVKLADRLHNLRSMVNAGEAFKKKYIKETEDYYVALAKDTDFEDLINETLLLAKSNLDN